MPPAALRFLVVDDNGDSRQLLVKTLARKYPGAGFRECSHGDPAVVEARDAGLTAIVAHRTFDHEGETLVRLLRQANPTVPIVMVSGSDQTSRARAAGADAFLDYNRWLMIGIVVGDAVAAKQAAGSQPPFRSLAAGAEPAHQPA